MNVQQILCVQKLFLYDQIIILLRRITLLYIPASREAIFIPAQHIFFVEAKVKNEIVLNIWIQGNNIMERREP